MQSIVDLHNQIMGDPVPPYDRRCALSEQDYYTYQNNVGHTYYLYLLKLVKRIQPRKILELGTSIGRSANFMMLALPRASSLVTVDVGSFLRSDLFEFSNDPRLTIIFGNDLDEEVFSKVGGGFDLLFIDSEHSFEQVTQEWDKYKSLLVDGAIVVMDDIRLNDGMSKFWDSLPFEKIDTGAGLHFSGFGLFVYRLASSGQR
jgi:predicted O-methyltransferase YrrM